MIISASRRTDIPAFYADWFMNRVRDGYFHRVNPFNTKQVTGISLKAEDVDAICFWTKNPAPLAQHLDELDRYGLNYYFQFTLNSYGKLFEPATPPLNDRIATFQRLAGRIGPERLVWRYDPVILTSSTPVAWHLEQAERIAAQLKSSTRRLVFSFYDFYGKGRGRLNKALQGTGSKLYDITAPEHKQELQQIATGLKAICDRYGLQIGTCSEEIDLSATGIPHGACIDSNLIRELFRIEATTRKDKHQRALCRCVESADMGIYNTCHFRCAYCYANFNESMIESNRNKHVADSPSLLDRYEAVKMLKACGVCQPRLNLL